MRHLVRAGALLAAVLIFVFIGLRVVPIPAFLVEYGFHPKSIEEDVAEWSSLPIQYVQSSVCLDCHQDKYSMWEKSNHSTVSCENCHGPAKPHLETGAGLIVDTSRELCGTCHARLVSRPSGFPQVDMAEMGKQAGCITCHDPHDPRAGMPPLVPHALEERTDCQSCHASHEPFEAIPPQLPHALEGRTECLSCHGPQEFRGATLPKIPHSLEGRTECLSCHGPQEFKGATLPLIPHSLEGRADCLVCHNASGIKPFSGDHIGRTSATCLNCHRSK